MAIHPYLALQALGLIDSHGVADPVSLRRYIMNADNRILDMSVNARTFPEWMRTGALIQSRGQCEIHGCDVPHNWLQTDHLQPVHQGGQTQFNNAGPKCRPDNQAKGAPTKPPGTTEPHHRATPEEPTHHPKTTPTTPITAADHSESQWTDRHLPRTRVRIIE